MLIRLIYYIQLIFHFYIRIKIYNKSIWYKERRVSFILSVFDKLKIIINLVLIVTTQTKKSINFVVFDKTLDLIKSLFFVTLSLKSCLHGPGNRVMFELVVASINTTMNRIISSSFIKIVLSLDFKCLRLKISNTAILS